jgi:hypothetical protein
MITCYGTLRGDYYCNFSSLLPMPSFKAALTSLSIQLSAPERVKVPLIQGREFTIDNISQERECVYVCGIAKFCELPMGLLGGGGVVGKSLDDWQGFEY